MNKSKKTRSSRVQSEKKTNVTSVRLTDEQQMKIQELAKSNNMSVSSYLIYKALEDEKPSNNEKPCTPNYLVRTQNIINMVYYIAMKYEPDMAEALQEEEDQLWQESL
ncbi:MAG: plasmid mobilization protein [Porcipelethomonas sp.]